MSDVLMGIAAVAFSVSLLAFAAWAGDHLTPRWRRRKP